MLFKVTTKVEITYESFVEADSKEDAWNKIGDDPTWDGCGNEVDCETLDVIIEKAE